MKRVIITVLMIVIVLLGIFCAWFYAHEGSFPWSYFLNFNSIEITSNEGTDLRDIRISLLSYNFDEQDIETLIFNGETKKTIPEEYGENDWQVSYQNKVFAEFRHFKTNFWHDHHYKFVFRKSDGYIECWVTIDGPDSMTKILILN